MSGECLDSVKLDHRGAARAHAANKMLGGQMADPTLAADIIEAVDGRTPHSNRGVRDVFSEACKRPSRRDVEERSITVWLRQNAPGVAALWPEAPLTASWFDWRLRVGPEHVETLDRAWCAAVGLQEPPWALKTSVPMNSRDEKEAK